MSTDVSTSEETATEDAAAERMNLEVKIQSLGACERRITVTVPQEDIQKYYDLAYGEMIPRAAVPGFRVGKAPRKLVESRFRKEVADQVKGQVLMASIGQATEEAKLSAISEPDLDIEAVTMPDSGPLTFEYKIEVRPEFDMPNWKGLKIEKPVREFSAQDIDQQIKQILRRHGRLIPHSGAAELGDYITTNITFKNAAGVEVSKLPEQELCVRRELSFRDGKIVDFGQVLVGVKAGETRSAHAAISEEAPNEALRGQTITAEFEVLDVKKLDMPELNQQFLTEIGDFKNEGELRDFVKDELNRQLGYHQRQKARQQIPKALTAGANWELPPDLLRRQSGRELQRRVMELQRSGFQDDVINMHANELRHNTLANTAIALKEHFILERLAEDEKIADEQDDYNEEIRLIAQQTGESPRRVRASLEKRDQMDILRNQIIERKVIDLVLKEAEFHETPFISPAFETEAVDEAATGEGESEIPDAVAVADTGPAPGMSAPTIGEDKDKD